jgi:protoporphyrinogen oxidase
MDKMDKNKVVAIIGAGPAGITAAYELAKNNIEVHVYEASTQAGGMAKTIDLWGQRVDIGPHRFFSSDPRVNKLWLEVVEKDYQMVNRLTRIFYKNKFFYYPLRAFNALFNLGLIQAFLCITSYARYKLFPLKDESTFENWIINRFGKRLYTIFFKAYSEKLWGISCKELDADFATQRIKKLSLYEAIKNALFKGMSNKHKTLVDQFAYPLEGAGMVYERMARKVEDLKGKVFFESPVNKVIIDNDNITTGIELATGEFRPYDYVISSMPINLLVTRFPNIPEKVKNAVDALKFRNTIIVYLKVNNKDLFPDQWLYIHSPELRVGRVTNFRNWVPTLCKDEESTIIALEYWCYNSDSMWNSSDKDLIETASLEIEKTGLISGEKIEDGYVYKIQSSYPVYNSGYKEQLSHIENYIRSIKNLDLIGRCGAFKYNNQDHSILMGILVAENIVNSKVSHDLWAINTGDEYQESSIITETGLLTKN